MIRTEHTVIRATIPDDAGALHLLYATGKPRAALLDSRRELLAPTRGELEETLVKQDATRSGFYTVETHEGEIAGFCALRGQNPEGRFGEVALLFLDPGACESPLACEVLDFLKQRAFVREHLHKVVAHCLESESALRQVYLAHGFHSAGMQRDAYFTKGRYEGIESLACIHVGQEGRHAH